MRAIRHFRYSRHFHAVLSASKRHAVAAVSAFLLSAQPGLAQTDQSSPPPQFPQSPPSTEPAESTPPAAAEPMVNVDLSNIADRIASNLQLDASQIPLSIMVPARVAANVCSMEQALMAQRAAGGGMNCMADHTTSALDAMVDAQMKK